MPLIDKVKANLMLSHEEDNLLLEGYIGAAVSYAQGFQHLSDNHYTENSMSAATEQGVIMLATHFYESRDGSTGGFFNDNVSASGRVWEAVHLLLRMGKEWQV